jgi:thiamine-phosphate pyrophosphorylase
MKLIVVSSAYDLENEIGLIELMFRKGMNKFHLRKPNYTTKDYETFLDRLHPKFRKHIIIHSRHNMSFRYKLKGINLGRNHKRTKLKTFWKVFKMKLINKKLIVTSEFDSLTQFNASRYPYDYVMLSPVYDSISKKGKRSKFNHSRLKKAFKTKKNYEVYAGGGITADRIAHCQELGFDGVAVMGSIWESEDPIASFEECLNVCNKLASDGKVE